LHFHFGTLNTLAKRCPNLTTLYLYKPDMSLAALLNLLACSAGLRSVNFEEGGLQTKESGH
jgi:hypothetical protein